MSSIPNVGDRAPDFELDGTDGRFALAAQRGRRVLLLFYPMDRGVVCVRQFSAYARERARLEALDAAVVGISGGTVASHESFREHCDIPFALLADTELRTASAYGVTEPVFGTRRAVFAVDADGIVRHRYVHALGVSFQSVDDLRSALAEC